MVQATQKRRRRTRREMEEIREALFDTAKEHNPVTVRQVFYQLVSRGVIEKTEAEYQRTVCRLLADMRRKRVIPYGWIADQTRWMRKPDTHSSLARALEVTASCYRRALWDDQDAYVEVWLEKDALAGVLVDVTDRWDVPLMVTRGYPSLSFLAGAAEGIAYEEKPCHLYYFGDHDPSGVDIPRFVEREIRRLAPEAEFDFHCVAVTLEQVEFYSLPTRPMKKTDSRAKRFIGESVEVDALPPDVLRRMAEECIEQHVDPFALNATKDIEEQEKATLQRIAEATDWSWLE